MRHEHADAAPRGNPGRHAVNPSLGARARHPWLATACRNFPEARIGCNGGNVAHRLLLLLLASLGAVATATAADLGRLGNDLTPIGAERAGNAEGTIPAWDGGLMQPPAGWTPQQGYIDPFPNDKPLFTIDSGNVAQHEAKLTKGQAALLRKYPQNFRMNVYPTRRTVGYPKAVTDRVMAQAGKVSLQGFGLKDLNGSTTPFPIPQSGLEAIWNHLVRYLGGGIVRAGHSFPVRPNGDFYKIGFRSQRIYAPNVENVEPNRLFYALGYFTEPATLRGTIFLVHEPVDQVAEQRSAWIYNSGQRRVRRAPDLAYDGINDGSEGMLTTDQVDGYNGAPDRYEWKLLGKREIYVPYNTYKLSDKALKYKTLIQPKSHQPRLRALRVAPRMGRRRDAQAGTAPHLRQAHVVPGRRQLVGARRRRVRHTRRIVARIDARFAAGLRRAGAVLSLRHLPRPEQRRLPGGRPRQRGEGTDPVQCQGKSRATSSRTRCVDWAVRCNCAALTRTSCDLSRVAG